MMDPANENSEQGSAVLDEIAAFLMHHAYDAEVTDADRLQTFALVEAYQEGDDPSAVDPILRDLALRFRDRPEYRPEWRPGPPPTS
jgi:hypothetical protein